MKAIQFFQHASVGLPLKERSGDFASFLERRFAEYLKLVDSLDSSDAVASAIKAERSEIAYLCARIREALAAYHAGLPGKAFGCLDDGMEGIWPRFKTRCWNMPCGSSSPISRQLYRIRVAGPEGGLFSKADLFHIPFEARHKVARQRYSIPGLPCLYLGASLYVCWEEMGRPPLDTVYMSRFEVSPPTGQLNVLDFSMSPQSFAALMSHSPLSQEQMIEIGAGIAVCWPLIAACSVRRKHQDAPFIAEYIVPQLLLQWVTERNIVQGIAYFSVRLEPRTDPHLAQTNFVFPVREIASEGACSALKRCFVMTEPASWQLLEAEDTIHSPHAGNSQWYDMPVELVRGKAMPYGVTQFGRKEAEMLKHRCSSLS